MTTTRARARRKPATPATVAFLDGLLGGDAQWGALIEQARVNQDVAHALYDLRTAHGLTQRELAELVGTKQPVIARLEDADYEGHSLSMLSRIAAALRQRLKIEFVPLSRVTPSRQPTRVATARPRAGMQVREAPALNAAAAYAAVARRKKRASAQKRSKKTSATVGRAQNTDARVRGSVGRAKRLS